MLASIFSKKKTKVVTITTILLCSYLALMFVVIKQETVSAWSAPSIEVWGEQLLSSECSKNRFPGITRTMNGTLVVVFGCDDADDNPRTFKYMRSYDNGTTWTSPTEIFTFAGSSWDGLWNIKTAGNGDVLFAPVYKQAAEGGGNWSTHFYRSQDQGQTFQSWQWYEGGTYTIYDWILYEKNLYSFTMDPMWGAGNTPYLSVSYDNGSTWAKFGNDIPADGVDEWYAIPMHNNGTWRTIHRDDQGWDTVNYITYDNGTTWNSHADDLPMDNNRGPSMMWLDDQVILSITEGSLAGDSCYIHESHNNMTSWNLVKTLGAGSGNNYGRGCSLPKRVGDIGGWGYVVYAIDNNLYGCWIANNASQDWIWPPGPDNSGSEFYTTPENETVPELLAIAGGTNGTVIYDSTPTINWTVVTDASQYWLQIATDSAFTSLEANYTDVNQWNYPANCEINETRVSFTLPTELSSYNRYYVRVKAYVKN